MISSTLIIDSLESLQNVSSTLASVLTVGDVVFLRGDLGSGKTTFAQFFIRSLMGENEPVSSPTFSLIHFYESPKGAICHSDLYRIKNKEELEEIGLYEAFSHTICLIEWPERLEGGYIPKNYLDISIEIVTETQRRLTIHSVGLALSAKMNVWFNLTDLLSDLRIKKTD